MTGRWSIWDELIGVMAFEAKVGTMTETWGAVHKWHVPVAEDITTPIAVGPEGHVYFGVQMNPSQSETDDHRLAALAGPPADMSTPSDNLIWTFQVPDEISGSPSVASDGTVYFGCDDNNLYSVSAQGALNWTFDAGANVETKPAVRSDGVIIFGASDDVYAISPDGSLLWETDINSDMKGGGAALASDGTVYIGTKDGDIFALSGDGQVLWSTNIGEQVYGSPVIDPTGRIVAVDDSDIAHVHVLNPAGAIVWQYPIGDANLTYSSPAVASDGTIYAVSDTGVFCLSSDGALVWQYTSDDFSGGVTIASDGTAIASDKSHLYGFWGDSPLAESDWPKYGQNPSNSGQEP